MPDAVQVSRTTLLITHKNLTKYEFFSRDTSNVEPCHATNMYETQYFYFFMYL